MDLTLSRIAELTGGRLDGDGARRVSRVRPLEEAGPGDLSFVADVKALARLADCRAEALIVAEGVTLPARDGAPWEVVVCASPFAAMAIAVEAMYPPIEPDPGVHPAAVVHPGAQLGEDVRVDAQAVIGDRARLGDGVRVGAGAYVAPGVVVGAGTVIHANAIVYPRVTFGRDCVVHAGAVVGADGFGFTQVDGRHVKVPQVGGVEIGDDVEIGANSCIDAGTFAPTRIGDNTKIDDLVMVGHNNQIGRSVLLCGQVGLAGSNIIEDHVILAGQTGVSGHLTIGKGAAAAAKTAVVRSVKPGERVGGSPHMPFETFRRVWKASQRLPEMRREMRGLLRRMDEIERLVDSEIHPPTSP